MFESGFVKVDAILVIANGRYMLKLFHIFEQCLLELIAEYACLVRLFTYKYSMHFFIAYCPAFHFVYLYTSWFILTKGLVIIISTQLYTVCC